jgi:hypothetical protein
MQSSEISNPIIPEISKKQFVETSSDSVPEEKKVFKFRKVVKSEEPVKNRSFSDTKKVNEKDGKNKDASSFTKASEVQTSNQVNQVNQLNDKIFSF